MSKRRFDALPSIRSRPDRAGRPDLRFQKSREHARGDQRGGARHQLRRAPPPSAVPERARCPRRRIHHFRPGCHAGAPKTQIRELRAHVYFPPEQIYVSQAEGIFCGVRISATGQLIKRNDYKPSGEISDEEWRQRLLLVQRIADELHRLSFSRRSARAPGEICRRPFAVRDRPRGSDPGGDRLRRGDYEMTNLSVAAEWANQTLQIKQCEWSDNAGNFSGRASWSRETKRDEFQGRSTLDAKRFLDAVGLPAICRPRLHFATAPRAFGVRRFAESAPKLSLIGRVASRTSVTKPCRS